MLFKSKNTILCIEISPWGINILEGTCSGKQVKINNCLQLSERPETNEALVKKIALTIRKMGARAKVAHLAIYHPYIEEQFIQLSNLSKKEALTLVKRRVKKKEHELLAHLQQDENAKAKPDKKACRLYSDYQIRGKEGLLFAFAPQTLVDEYIQALETIEIRPQMVTSLPLALTNTLFFMAPETKDSGKSYTSFLYITPHEGWLIIANQNNFFSREILFQDPNLKHQSPEVSENIVVKSVDLSRDTSGYQNLLLEVARSFLYIKKQEKDAQISSLLVGSTGNLPEEIIDDLAKKVQVPVSLFDPTEKLDLGDMAKKDPELPKTLKAFPISLGLLANTNNQISINLVPLRIRDYRKHMARRLLIAFFLIAYFVSIGAGYMGLTWAQQNYRQAIDTQQTSITQLTPVYLEAKKIEQSRQRRDFHLSVLKRFENKSPLWRGVLYELSLVSRSNTILSSLDIVEARGKWNLIAKGAVSADTSKRARQDLKNFLERLNKSVFFDQPEAKDIKMSPRRLKKGALGSAATGTQLKFNLRCKILY